MSYLRSVRLLTSSTIVKYFTRTTSIFCRIGAFFSHRKIKVKIKTARRAARCLSRTGGEDSWRRRRGQPPRPPPQPTPNPPRRYLDHFGPAGRSGTGDSRRSRRSRRHCRRIADLLFEIMESGVSTRLLVLVASSGFRPRPGRRCRGIRTAGRRRRRSAHSPW